MTLEFMEKAADRSHVTSKSGTAQGPTVNASWKAEGTLPWLCFEFEFLAPTTNTRTQKYLIPLDRQQLPRKSSGDFRHDSFCEPSNDCHRFFKRTRSHCKWYILL